MLAVGDEAVDSHDNLSYITVCIKKSKNDQLTHGIIIHVGKSNWRVCAVSAVVSYLAICSASPGPSFICEDEIVLSRHRLGLEAIICITVNRV
uniref:Uncharacterized protein n=1 Tax=Amphimedon queenslandica TaxID=400682 RepID=A0A1X7VA98_AMPQE